MNKLTKIALGTLITASAIVGSLEAKTPENYNPKPRIEQKDNKIADYAISTGLIVTPFITTLLLGGMIDCWQNRHLPYKGLSEYLSKD